MILSYRTKRYTAIDRWVGLLVDNIPSLYFKAIRGKNKDVIVLKALNYHIFL